MYFNDILKAKTRKEDIENELVNFRRNLPSLIQVTKDWLSMRKWFWWKNGFLILKFEKYVDRYYLPTPPLGQDMTQGQFFKRSLTGLNSEFSFSSTSCLAKAEEPSLSYYLPIAGGRIIGFIPFPRVLVLCEMQSVSSRIWTRIAVFISYGDNDYTTGTSKEIYGQVSRDEKAQLKLPKGVKS